MGHAGYEAHFFCTFKYFYFVGTVTVTLLISLKIIQQFPYMLSRTRAAIVMGNDQLSLDRPDHTQILLVGLPLSFVDHPYSDLVRMDVSPDNHPY